MNPLAGIANRQARGLGSVFEGVAALVKQQEQASAAGQPLLQGGRAEPAFEFLTMGPRQLDGERGFAAAHGRRFQSEEQQRSGEGPRRLS